MLQGYAGNLACPPEWDSLCSQSSVAFTPLTTGAAGDSVGAYEGGLTVPHSATSALNGSDCRFPPWRELLHYN